MKKFYEIWKVVGFILVAIVLWPFLMPWVIIKRAYAKQRMFRDTETGRKKWYRFVMCLLMPLLYIPSLIIDLTVGYGMMAYVYYKGSYNNLDDLLEDFDKSLSEYLEDF